MKIDNSIFDNYTFPDDLKFNNTEFWLLEIERGVILCGLTDYTADRTGEIISIEFLRNAVNMQISSGERLLDVESLKENFSLNSPLTGTILQINHDCLEAPYIINESPYSDGWLFIIEITELYEFEKQNNYDEYCSLVMKEKEEKEIL